MLIAILEIDSQLVHGFMNYFQYESLARFFFKHLYLLICPGDSPLLQRFIDSISFLLMHSASLTRPEWAKHLWMKMRSLSYYVLIAFIVCVFVNLSIISTFS
jgi:hypothetical protein